MNIRFVVVMGGLALLLMSLAAIFSIAGSGVTRGSKVRWILVVALLPLLGWAFWWVRGARRT